jgi:hypothetical protein
MHILFYATILFFKIFGSTLVYRGTPVENHFLNGLMWCLLTTKRHELLKNSVTFFLTVLKLKVTVVWIVTPGISETARRFEEHIASVFTLQEYVKQETSNKQVASCVAYSSILNINVICSSETSVDIYTVLHTRRPKSSFISVFENARHWPLSQDNLIHSRFLSLFLQIRLMSSLLPLLGLPNDLFPSVFPLRTRAEESAQRCPYINCFWVL